MIHQDAFFKGTEGYVGTPEECRILFLFKEPNCGENKTVQQNEFWLKSIAAGEKKPLSNCYLLKLGTIAALLQGKEPIKKKDEEVWKEALQHTVYMNINPVSGKGTASKEYKDAVEFFAQTVLQPEEISPQGFKSRWKAIYEMPDQSTIVTIRDVFTRMYKTLNQAGMIVECPTRVNLTIRTKEGIRHMRSLQFRHENKTFIVLETYHPAARGNQEYQYCDISISHNPAWSE